MQKFDIPVDEETDFTTDILLTRRQTNKCYGARLIAHSISSYYHVFHFVQLRDVILILFSTSIAQVPVNRPAILPDTMSIG